MSERLIDLEHFPESEAAKRMLTYVTANWYDKSYVGKWVYEVMGIEMDMAVDIVKDLPNQFFVDTATWGLIYHEQKYGLPMQPTNTDYAARRKLIHDKMDTKAPMSPYRMEQLVKNATGYETHVHDINDAGYTFSHPNIFSIQLEGDDPLDFKYALKKIRSYKQSHTRFIFSVLMMVIKLHETILPRLTFRMEMPWWTLRILDGQYGLDGAILLDQVYPMEFRMCPRIVISHTEIIEWITATMRFASVIEETFIERIRHRMEMPWWTLRILDGQYALNGDLVLDQLYPMEFTFRPRVLIAHTEEISLTGRIRFGDELTESMEDMLRYRFTSTLWSGFLLDGRYDLDGTHELAPPIYPEFNGLTLGIPVETVEDIGFNLYIPSMALSLDGSGYLDGTYSLNSGREEL